MIAQTKLSSFGEDKSNFVGISYNGFVFGQFLKCFNINIPPDKDILLFSLVVQNRIFPKGVRPVVYGFRIFFHYPKQISRSIQTTKHNWPLQQEDSTYHMRFNVDGMEVLKRRNKRNVPCNEDWQNYDDRVMDQHVKTVGCRCPYQNTRNNYSVCRTTNEMRNAKIELSSDKLIKHAFPCRALENIFYTYSESNPSGPSWERKGQFWISVFIFNPRYKEISQSR